MTPKVFVDTDVVIDFLSDRQPFANPATQVFQLNEEGLIQMYLSAASINNIYYIVRRHLGHSETLKAINSLVDMTEIIGLGKNELLVALRNNFRDFEDAIQYSCALKIEGLQALLTRNVKDYSLSKIPVFTPEDYLKIFYWS